MSQVHPHTRLGNTQLFDCRQRRILHFNFFALNHANKNKRYLQVFLTSNNSQSHTVSHPFPATTNILSWDKKKTEKMNCGRCDELVFTITNNKSVH